MDINSTNSNVDIEQDNVDVELSSDIPQISLKTKSSINIEVQGKKEINIETPKVETNKNHANMENLDYENSGHTGFQPAGNYVEDNNYVHTDNNYTNADKEKLDGIEENANNYKLPEDVVQDPNYVHTDFNFTQAYKNKINNILPLIPQTRISQLVEDGVKYLKIDWDINDLIVNYQNKGKVKLFLYKYTKTGKKRWINQQTGEERYKTSVKKWVHPSNEYYPNSPAHQCWGIRSFQANPTFADDIDEIIENSDYPIANNGLVQTEYIISAGQNSLKIPLNDIVSPILKVDTIGPTQVMLPKLGDKKLVRLMGVKQKPAGSRCNQPIKFCLAVEDDVGHICIGSCLNVATIQLFKYRTGMNNHSGHGYSNGYSVLPDVGYSVFIK